MLRKLARGSGVVFVGKMLNSGFQYIFVLVLGRFLGAGDMGLFFLGLSILRLANTAAMLGFNTGLQRFVPEYTAQGSPQKARQAIRLAFLSSFLFSVALSGVMYLLAGTLAERFFKEPSLVGVLELFALCLPLYTVFQILISSLRSLGNIDGYTLHSSLTFPGSMLLFTCVAVFFKENLQWVLLAYLASLVFANFAGFLRLRKDLPVGKPSLSEDFETGKLLGYSVTLMGSGVLGFFLVWMDTLMLGFLGTSQQVGIYSAAARIAIFSNLLLTSINTIMGPTISRLFTSGDMPGLASAYKAGVRWIIHISLPIYLILFVFADEIMGLYGSGFLFGSQALIILSVGQLINVSVGSAGYLLSMTGRARIELINRIITVLVNFLLNWMLIPAMGINGAAIATAFSTAAVNLLRLLENYKFLKIHPFSKKLFFPVTIGKN
jgi:O-antigen/teichoic acid export membrane protein